MSLTPGTRLVTYEIVERIGGGGMGEVYKARDLKLRRDVALKVLREELARHPKRLRRFEQEARSASALNHPNIITIYDIGTHESTCFIAMEYGEGETLGERLSRGPLPITELLPIAAQTAEGLAKAHAAGIVHRDLKPANLMITNDGYAKILDFGLAKLVTLPTETSSESPTLGRGDTAAGTVMGTVGYMSPEQARGESVDYRSQPFAFGAILYEMATGKRAFQRDTVAETFSAVLRDPIAVPAGIPEKLRTVIERCVAKNPGGRYPSTRDIVGELHEAKEQAGDVSARAQPCVAVLPFTNMSADPEQEFFCDGIAEEIINALTSVSGAAGSFPTQNHALSACRLPGRRGRPGSTSLRPAVYRYTPSNEPSRATAKEQRAMADLIAKSERIALEMIPEMTA